MQILKDILLFISGLSIWQNPVLTFLLIAVVLVTVAIIILKGKYFIFMISNKFFGTSFKITEEKTRTCSDCILYMNSLREDYEVEKNSIRDSILKNQMNYSEQKLIEVETLIYSKYLEQVSKLNLSYEDESKQTTIFYGLMKDSIRVTKDEIRRSFKENGFHQIGGTDFSNYVKSRMSTIKALIIQIYLNRYPSHSMIVSKDTIIPIITSSMHDIEDILFEIYTRAKEVRLSCEKKIEDIKNIFAKNMDTFLGERNGTGNCTTATGTK